MHACIRAAAPAAVLLLAAGAAAAQAAPQTGAFVTRIGSDTPAVERFTRTAGELRGKLVVRSPRTAVREYTATLRRDGSTSRFAVTFGSPGAPAAQSAVMEMGADTTVTTLRQGDSTRVFGVATANPPLPFINLSYALTDQALLRARAGARLHAGRPWWPSVRRSPWS